MTERPGLVTVLCAVLACAWAKPVAADVAPHKLTVLKTCQAPPKAMRAELERLFKLAAEHATRTNICQDGPGEVTTIKIVSACLAAEQKVTVTYEVTVRHEVGGECTPYPACADGGPPSREQGSATIAFTTVGNAGIGIGLSALPKIPGVTLLTPLHKPHSMACKGKSPAWEPRAIPKA